MKTLYSLKISWFFVATLVVVSACGKSTTERPAPLDGGGGRDAGRDVGFTTDAADGAVDAAGVDADTSADVRGDANVVVDLAMPASCGNEVIEADEVCDGSAVPPGLCDSWSEGARCSADCDSTVCVGSFDILVSTSGIRIWGAGNEGRRALVTYANGGGGVRAVSVDLASGAMIDIADSVDIASTRISPNGKMIYISDFDSGYRIWSEDLGQLGTLSARPFIPHVDNRSLGFLHRGPTGNDAEYTFGVYKADGTEVLNLVPNAVANTFSGPAFEVGKGGQFGVIRNTANTRFIVDLWDGTIVEQFDPNPGTEEFTQRGDAVTYLEGGLLKVWHASTDSVFVSIHSSSGPASSPVADDYRLAYASSGSGWLWDPITATTDEICQNCARFVFSPTATKLAYIVETEQFSAFNKSTLYVYDIATGVAKEIESQVDPMVFGWSPDERLLLYQDSPSDSATGERPLNIADLSVDPPVLHESVAELFYFAAWRADSAGFFFHRPVGGNALAYWDLATSSTHDIAGNIRGSILTGPTGKVGIIETGFGSGSAFDTTTFLGRSLTGGQGNYFQTSAQTSVTQTFRPVTLTARYAGWGSTSVGSVQMLDLESGALTDLEIPPSASLSGLQMGYDAMLWVYGSPGQNAGDPPTATLRLSRP